MTEKIGAAEVLRITGNPICWIYCPKNCGGWKNEPENFCKNIKGIIAQGFYPLSIDRRVLFRMSDASGTSMLNVGERKRSEEILVAMGWPRHGCQNLPTHGGVCKGFTDASELTGLAADTPVIAGGGDQAAQAVG